MSDIFDVLETCLQDIENGADVEAVIAAHPHFAAELRPLLHASLAARARGMATLEPSPEVVRRGRAKVLQHAAQMREAKSAPRKRFIPAFQRFAIAFVLATLFLSSGTGLVRASSTALPGENLYPVKLTWENLRLFFAFDEQSREALEHSFRNERLHEVNELLLEGRRETIQFAGIYMEVNGVTYVSGVQIAILDTSILPTEALQNGVAVIVTGHTNAQGFVDVDAIELLPAGSVVPVGEPVEVETEQESNDNTGNENEVKEEDVRVDGQNENADDDAVTNEEEPQDMLENNSNDNSGKETGNDNQDDKDSSDDSGDDDNSGKGGGNSGSDGGDDGGGGDDDGGGSDDDGGDDD